VSDVGSTPKSSADLVSKLTHEIRGPVSTLRGLVGTTLTHYDRLSDEERREFLHLMRREADRLERTVEQVAFALKLDAGSVRFDIRPRDLAEIVRETAQAADTGDHPMEVDVAESIEAPVDGDLIASVVHQLIDNAVTFSPPDSPITIGLRRDGDGALIEVTDRGPGVPPDKREAVFERFADWRPQGYEDRPGTGLGLFISRTVAREHGGEASIADGPAGGTMLLVRLPVEG
jgi:two-component system, OmpR family, sensor histidine kinase KdpD